MGSEMCIRDRKTTVPETGNRPFVDSDCDFDRMYSGKLCKSYADFGSGENFLIAFEIYSVL